MAEDIPHEKLVDDISTEILEIINRRLKEADEGKLDMGEAIYIASVALAQVSAEVLVGNLPDPLVGKSAQFAKSFVKLFVGISAQITKAKGKDFFSLPTEMEEESSDESGSNWTTGR